MKVVLMDYSGNRTTISYLTFKGPDGSYLVTAKGGKIEGEGGSLLDIPEGALVGPTVIKVTTVPEANLPHPVPPRGKYLGAVNVDTGGINVQKEVTISIPLPEGFDPNTPVFLTQPQELVNADGSVEQVYVFIDSTKVVNGRITTACWPFDGPSSIMGIFSFIMFMPYDAYTPGSAAPKAQPVVVSGYAYRDMDDSGTFSSPPDLPIKKAIIQNPGATGFISYTRSDGFYATVTDLWAFALCIYLLVAITKKKLDIPCSLYTFLQILEVNLFEKKPISTLVAEALKQKTDAHDCNQPNLFNY